MRRDMDVIRSLLALIDERKDGVMASEVSIEGVDPDDVILHFQLLHDAGLIKSNLENPDQRGLVEIYATRLTWEGYEFLAAAKNDTIWVKTKETIKEKGLSLTFDLFKGLLLEKLKEAVLK